MKHPVAPGVRPPQSRMIVCRDVAPPRRGEIDAVATLREFYREAMEEPLPEALRRLLDDLRAEKRKP